MRCRSKYNKRSDRPRIQSPAADFIRENNAIIAQIKLDVHVVNAINKKTATRAQMTGVPWSLDTPGSER